MAEQSGIVHIIFDKYQSMIAYYSHVNPYTVAMGGDWSLIRVLYPKGLHDGYYVFAVMSRSLNVEVEDTPRALVEEKALSKSEIELIKHLMSAEHQPDGPERIVYEIAPHVFVKSLAEVEEHFENNPEALKPIHVEIFRIDCFDNPPPAFKDCHVFLACNKITGRQIDMPLAVIRKSECDAKDDRKIQMIEYYDYLGDDIEDAEPPAPGSRFYN